jgi:hypothetical protein
MYIRAPDTQNKIGVPESEYMGDDSKSLYFLADKLTPHDIDQIKTVSSDVTAENSMDLNKAKTSVRLFLYEYLKKRAEYGWFIPRIYQLQIHATERTNQHLDFQEQIRGYTGLLAEYASRGADHKYLTYHFMFFQNLRRRVKIGFSNGSGFVNAPPQIGFTPNLLNGAGSIPWSLAALSKEAALYMVYNPVYREMCNYAAYIMDFNTSGVEREIIADIQEQGLFDKGEKFITQYTDPNRGISSSNAVRFLKEEGIDMGELAYRSRAERAIKQSIRDNHNFAAMIQESKFRKSGTITERYKLAEEYVIEANNVYVDCPEPLATKLSHRLQYRGFVGVLWRDYVRNMTTSQQESDHHFELIRETVNKVGKIAIIFNSPYPTPDITVHEDDYSAETETEFTDFGSEDFLLDKFYLMLEAPPNPMKDYMAEKFAWLRPFRFEYTDEIDEILPYAPVAGVSEDLAQLMKSVGVSGRGDEFAYRVNQALLSLTRDPLFPNDLRSETIFGFITKPGIIDSQVNIQASLVGMGAREEDASEIAATIYRIASDFTMVRKTSQYSTSDQIIGHLDLSAENYDRLVDFPETLAINPSLSKTLKSLAIIAVVIAPPWDAEGKLQPRRKVKITYDQHFFSEMETSLNPHFIPPILDFSGIFKGGLM